MSGAPVPPPAFAGHTLPAPAPRVEDLLLTLATARVLGDRLDRPRWTDLPGSRQRELLTWGEELLADLAQLLRELAA